MRLGVRVRGRESASCELGLESKRQILKAGRGLSRSERYSNTTTGRGRDVRGTAA